MNNISNNSNINYEPTGGTSLPRYYTNRIKLAILKTMYQRLGRIDTIIGKLVDYLTIPLKVHGFYCCVE
jgi:hypothetical protein